jgi:hypothetical protein
MADLTHRFDFRDKDWPKKIGPLILKHSGPASAITMEQIAVELCPYDWADCTQGPGNMPWYPNRENIRRTIRDTVRELKRKGLKIFALKQNGGGYYVATTPREEADGVRPQVHQAIDMLRTAEKQLGADLGADVVAANFAAFGSAVGSGQIGRS